MEQTAGRTGITYDQVAVVIDTIAARGSVRRCAAFVPAGAPAAWARFRSTLHGGREAVARS